MLGTFYGELRKLKRSNLCGLRPLVNLAYYDPQTVVMPLKNLDYVVVDGCKFRVNDQIESVQRVKGNNWFTGIRPEDTALDIGANIGAITIPLAYNCKKVYAVEPLFYMELLDNIKLNKLQDKVEVLANGIGLNRRISHVSFSSKEADVEVIPFETILKRVGPVDFLKVDCEGAEWDFKPEQCQGIRELRFEFHVRRKTEYSDSRKFKEWEKWLTDNNYQFKVDYGQTPSICVPFSKCILLNASRGQTK